MHKKSPWAKRVKKDRFKRKYLSKMQAQRLLQVDNEGLRRLLILKGVYPRSISKSSKQKDSGNSKQYYLAREIKWLVHDTIRSGVADFGAWEKQTRRAKAMQRYDTLKVLQEAKSKPGYRLDATLKERYPYFVDALKDVDDAMSMIALYSFLTPEIKSETTVEFHHALPTGLHEKAKATLKEWMDFVADSHILTRTFVSIKGFYYEAYVGDQRIVWLMPHEFAHAAADGVQQYILITFLEFYVELMRFVLFKLKHDRRREQILQTNNNNGFWNTSRRHLLQVHELQSCR
jgi:pescadillo protein